MLHEPAAEHQEDERLSAYKASLGVKMFILYALVYAGFVAIGLVDIDLYKKQIFWGLNLAVFYGFGLIIFALVLALIYDRACGAKEAEMTPAAGNSDGEGN